MRTIFTNSSAQAEGITIFGDIQYHDVPVTTQQKGKIESEMVDWALKLNWGCIPQSEVQCWITFHRLKIVQKVICQVEVIGVGTSWGSLDFSNEPVQAFRHCLADLELNE